MVYLRSILMIPILTPSLACAAHYAPIITGYKQYFIRKQSGRAPLFVYWHEKEALGNSRDGWSINVTRNVSLFYFLFGIVNEAGELGFSFLFSLPAPYTYTYIHTLSRVRTTRRLKGARTRRSADVMSPPTAINIHEPNALRVLTR